MFGFKVLKTDKKSRARIGFLITPHGKINTPNLAIVATKGAIRGLDFEKAKNFGAEIFMINTFHFFVNERYKIVKKFGGLHKFLNIKYPLMTDSGGFQVFSLGFGLEHGVGKVADIFPEESKNQGSYFQSKRKGLVKISEDGAEFKLPEKEKKLFLSPEFSIKIQKILGADIIFSFDECTSPLSDKNYTKNAMERTHRWAERCLKEFGKSKNQVLFGIVQGGEYEDLRKESARFINSLPFFGFGIGGSLGKSKKDIVKVLNSTIPYLEERKPRHLLGIGEIDDIFNAIECGVDLFDCVISTRWARHGTAFSFDGRINLKSSKYLKDKEPIDKNCNCRVCKNFSRAYICHLVRERELFGILLLVEHNIFWILNLFRKIRTAIKWNRFLKLKKMVLSNKFGF